MFLLLVVVVDVGGNLSLISSVLLLLRSLVSRFGVGWLSANRDCFVVESTAVIHAKDLQFWSYACMGRFKRFFRTTTGVGGCS